jgi:MerR family redox-sensitive transcriptional activator SoxR
MKRLRLPVAQGCPLRNAQDTLAGEGAGPHFDEGR